MKIHSKPSELAWKTVSVDLGNGKISKYEVEDWWDRVADSSWMFSEGNPAALGYAIRSGTRSPSLPLDDEVLYGKIDGMGYLVHVKEVVTDDS